MQGDRDRRSKAFRARLLAGAALFVCVPFAGEALAQAEPQSAPSATPPVSDGLSKGAVYVDAGRATPPRDVITPDSTVGARVYLRRPRSFLRGPNPAHDLLNGAATPHRQGHASSP